MTDITIVSAISWASILGSSFRIPLIDIFLVLPLYLEAVSQFIL
jgi:hypothetical protein